MRYVRGDRCTIFGFLSVASYRVSSGKYCSWGSCCGELRQWQRPLCDDGVGTPDDIPWATAEEVTQGRGQNQELGRSNSRV